MAYRDFTLESARKQLGLSVRPGSPFADIRPVPVPEWLTETLRRYSRYGLVSEKARGEFIVTPVLVTVADAAGVPVNVLSRQRLDVNPDRGLVGECDYLLSLSEPLPQITPPLITVVEAMKADIELGLGQCVAQMAAAAEYNSREEADIPAVYGVVTTGELWQFLVLRDQEVTLCQPRLYLTDLGRIMGVLLHFLTL